MTWLVPTACVSAAFLTLGLLALGAWCYRRRGCGGEEKAPESA